MAFPTSPSNGDLHTEFGRTYKYVSETNSWTAATTPAPENVISTVTAFESAADLPLVNNNPGDTTFVAEDNSFRLWTGNGWFEIALANTAPTITVGANASYTLNSDGTPTVITMSATDPEGTPIVWGYQVTGGSLEDTSITNVGGEFTITPGTVDATFDLTFTASDGVNIDTSASSFTLSFGPDWSLTHTLDNPNPYGGSAADYFGSAIAISGNYAIIGAYYEDDAVANDQGKAYIYNVTTGALVSTIDNYNYYYFGSSDWFAYSVAMSNRYAIICAYLEDVNQGPTDTGRVYIYEPVDYTDWASGNRFVGSILNPNLETSNPMDNFGSSMSTSGNYAIIGAPYEDVGAPTSGSVYIFDISTGSLDGTLVKTLTNPNPYGTAQSDQFGHSVAMSGNYAIVSAWTEAEAGGSDSGKCYIYKTNNGTWSDAFLLHTLDNPNAYNTPLYDYFGGSVAISGNYAIVGAVGEDDAGGSSSSNSSGKAYIFNVTTGALVHTLDNPNAYGTSATDNFGWSVAIDGNYAVVGATQEDDAGGTNSGKVYVFDVTTGALLKTIDNPNAYGTSENDSFGSPVAVSGEYILVGTRLEDDAGGSASGKAYIFKSNQ